MPHDPHTFKNLYPFPNKEAILAFFQKGVLTREIKVPQDRITDSKEWILEQTQDKFLQEKKLWQESEEQAKRAWQKHQETEHGFSHLPESLKQKIHDQVWSDGHSGGYGDMNNKYCDWVPVILEVYEFGLYRCNCGKEQLKDSKRYDGPRGNHTRVAGEICE